MFRKDNIMRGANIILACWLGTAFALVIAAVVVANV